MAASVEVQGVQGVSSGEAVTRQPAAQGSVPVRVLLADDHVVFRESMKVAIESGGECVVVGEAARAREVYQQLDAVKPDVLVIDLLLADTDGISLVRELKRRRIKVPTLLLTRVAHRAFVRDALSAGVVGYALKDQPLTDIIGAIQTVALKRRYLAPSLPVPAAEGEKPEDGSALDTLSAREREIFWRLVEGWTTKEVGRELCISPKTVEAHRCRINEKLGVRSTIQLMRLAVTEGLI